MAGKRNHRREIAELLDQARKDLEDAEKILGTEAYNVVAFLCQQSVEKGMKALFMHKRRQRPEPTHNLTALGRDLSAPANLTTALGDLAADYTAARYPGAANGVPHVVYTKEKAKARIAAAKDVWKWLDRRL